MTHINPQEAFEAAIQLCPICCAPAHSPFRMWKGDKIVGGCVDAFHDGALVVPSQSASFHNRPDAKEIRRQFAQERKRWEREERETSRALRRNSQSA